MNKTTKIATFRKRHMQQNRDTETKVLKYFLHAPLPTNINTAENLLNTKH